jgi:hypothetical protein
MRKDCPRKSMLNNNLRLEYSQKTLRGDYPCSTQRTFAARVHDQIGASATHGKMATVNNDNVSLQT